MTVTAQDLQNLKPNVQRATRMLKLLASEHRLMILCRLFEGEASVSDLADYLGQAIAGTSQHLAKMRAENLVTTRRDGQTIYYSISDPAAQRLMETLCKIYKA
ncbi:metalloregulator ArsR/SmtB family transcription factor [Asticcacaulis sp. DW145]|uniref:Metalloregulator ArsR/SmtB family transcription factor n=1 Tax=Asticcacaulis currens TaxID=2984210 RepID=A0ABT5IIR8_9CAUL|nr:metalloregulator ArsR/SmtB family transcription factor [Asticcacaulis currens]MDC7696105.1 metalloregulator ArsR/SmtB family transcription factor [Asticcacaulis currens]BEV10709.1 metalloregulator ArsR/SmtB family transcription factor [Asticcacaulis sp. DW145]